MSRGATPRETRNEALEFARLLDRVVDQVSDDVEAVQREFVLLTVESVTVGNPRYGSPGIPVDTGYARNASLLSLGAPQSMDPGEPPKDAASSTLDKSGASAVAAMALAATAMPLGGAAYWTNSSGYADVLEDGHSPQAPNGFVGPTVAHAQLIAEDAVKNVRGDSNSVDVAA